MLATAVMALGITLVVAPTQDQTPTPSPQAPWSARFPRSDDGARAAVRGRQDALVRCGLREVRIIVTDETPSTTSGACATAALANLQFAPDGPVLDLVIDLP